MPATYRNDQQPWHVISGSDALDSLEGEIGQRGIASVLLLSTRSLAHSGGVLDQVREQLKGRIAAEFVECDPHVPVATVMLVRDLLGQSGAEAIIAVGGGSVMDTAKTAALAAATGADEEALILLASGEGPADFTPIPVIALPTGLAASEFTNITSFVTPEDGVKHMVRGPCATSRLIVLDPRLAHETPDSLWVSTGFKVLSDTCEQLANPDVHPIAQPMLLEAAAALFESLVVSGGRSTETDLRAYLGVWSAYFTTFSASGGLGPGTVIRHWLGGATGAPHSMIASVLLPEVLERAVGLCPAIADQLTARTQVDDFGASISAALVRAGLPQRLADLGIDASILDRLPAAGLGDVSAAQELTTRDEILAILTPVL